MTLMKIRNAANSAEIPIPGPLGTPANLKNREEVASFTLADTDNNTVIDCNHATVDIVVTVPTGLATNLFVAFDRTGAAEVTIVGDAGVTFNKIDAETYLLYTPNEQGDPTVLWNKTGVANVYKIIKGDSYPT